MKIVQCLYTFPLLLAIIGGVGCGGGESGAPPIDCHPASVASCTPTGKDGCDLFVAGDGLVVAAAACSGGDAHKGCIAGDHLACVDACADVASCK